MNTLYTYVREVLEPTYNQTGFVPDRINRIANVLRCNSSLSLDRVIPGGSYEKGTMLRYKPDVDVVLVFNKEPGVKRDWTGLMRRVYDALRDAFPEAAEIDIGRNVAIHVKFEKHEEVNFDIVPSFAVNSPLQMAGVKTSKIYQGISSLWHLEYIRPRKNLPCFTEIVRLLKDWKNEHKLPLKSFHMELIAASAYHWRMKNCYNLEDRLQDCFVEIHEMAEGTPVYPVNWKYFDEDEIKGRDDYPILIDPANPRNNLLEGLTQDECSQIRKLAKGAVSLLEKKKYGPIFDPQNKTNRLVLAS
jgi:hypothetical protein